MSKQVNTIVNSIIKYLHVSKKIDLLPEILNQLQKKAMLIDAEGKAYVSSSYKLSLLELVKIRKALKIIFKKDLKIINQVNPSLIGGLRISVQDKVIDLSLDKTLINLKEKLKHG